MCGIDYLEKNNLNLTHYIQSDLQGNTAKLTFMHMINTNRNQRLTTNQTVSVFWDPLDVPFTYGPFQT